MAFTEELISRHLASVVSERMCWAPVVVVSGARTSGKSTLLGQCAANSETTVVDLDDPAMRQLIEQDTEGYISRLPRPVLIDEFQRVLEILDVIKTELNRGAKPGQFLLTGSTRYLTLPKASQSLTGRAHLMTLWPLSQGELRGHKESFLDTILEDPAALLVGGKTESDRQVYERMILLGGYPLARELPSDADRRRWFRDLLNLVVKRDILTLKEIRRQDRVVDVVHGLASQTGQILNISKLSDRLDITSNIAAELTGLLEAVYIVHRLPAYGRTLSSRVGRSPKIHMVDTGLAASMLGVTEHRLRALQPTVLTDFGHLVESFAVNELMKQAGWSDSIVDFYHFRTRDRQEVDLVIQTDDGRVAAIEVKAGSKVSDADFAGMRLLKESLGNDFMGGILLNLGHLSYRYEPDMYVMPLEMLWAPTSS